MKTLLMSVLFAASAARLTAAAAFALTNDNPLTIEAASRLIQEHRIEELDKEGWTPLFLAVKQDSNSVVGLLLESGASVTARDRMGRSPVHLAAEHAGKAVLSSLLNAGADATVADTNGWTPIFYAANFGNTNVLPELLKLDKNVNRKDLVGLTPLLIAVGGSEGMRRVQVVSALLEAGADPNLTDEKGLSPLVRAMLTRDIPVFRLLLRYGAHPDRLSSKGKSARDFARYLKDYVKDERFQQVLGTPSIPDSALVVPPGLETNTAPVFGARAIAEVAKQFRANATGNRRSFFLQLVPEAIHTGVARSTVEALLGTPDQDMAKERIVFYNLNQNSAVELSYDEHNRLVKIEFK